MPGIRTTLPSGLVVMRCSPWHASELGLSAGYSRPWSRGHARAAIPARRAQASPSWGTFILHGVPLAVVRPQVGLNCPGSLPRSSCGATVRQSAGQYGQSGTLR